MDGGADDLQALASQHHELMAARAAESDLDFAFLLQLQEAMAASLASQPSPSDAPPHTPGPIPPLPDEDGSSSITMTLQALELERFQQERVDFERSQAEMRRVSEDIRLKAHDERFAREVQEMSDDEWEEYGDNFERPIGRGFEGEEIDPFRLYVKGLRCEDDPNLSAVGAAILDTHGNIVLKIQKPLVGPRPAKEILEGTALIEGLNAVKSLGIKSVEVYVDSIILFNHITRRWALKQRKVVKVCEQIWSLVKQFERCDINLLPRCLMQFVIKLAKEVIDSQITKGVHTRESNHLNEVCNICLEEIDSSHMYSVNVCMHRFCFNCMRQHVEVKFLYGNLPGCPHEGCKAKIEVETSKKFLSPKLFELLCQLLQEASIPAAERVYCPYPKCSALMSRSEAIVPTIGSSSAPISGPNSGCRQCAKCSKLFCINCKVPWHLQMSCLEYKRFNPHPHPEDAKLKNLADKLLWRICPKCNQMIELSEGCYHITCRCGYEFCYSCGAPWNKKKQTCTCPLFDEHYILHPENANVGPYQDYYGRNGWENDYDDDYDSTDDDLF